VIGPPDQPPAGVLRLGVILARTNTIAVGIAKISVYPAGFEIDLFVVREDDETELEPASDSGSQPVPAVTQDPAETLSFALQFSDGRSVSDIGTTEAPNDGRGEPVMRYAERSDANGLRPTIWVQPLPPPGPLTLSCEWASVGIPLTRHTLDTQDILDAMHNDNGPRSCG
jgi:hypothetical protein